MKSIPCTPAEYQEVRSDIEVFVESGVFRSISFNAARNILQFCMHTSWMISACVTWFTKWVLGLPFPKRYYFSFALSRFKGSFVGCVRQPDASLLIPDRYWPTFALEAGYSKSYDDMPEDTRLLLEGSECRICIVILVNLEPLGNHFTTIQSGFVEIYFYDYAHQEMAQLGNRKVLYPVPRSHARQELSFQSISLLREKASEYEDIIQDLPAPPPLNLDKLREGIDDAVKEHLAFKSGEYPSDGDDTPVFNF